MEVYCPVQLNVVIGFKLNLSWDVLDVVGTVKRVDKVDDGVYTLGVQFDNLDDVNTKKVIKYLNEQMILQARNKRRNSDKTIYFS